MRQSQKRHVLVRVFHSFSSILGRTETLSTERQQESKSLPIWRKLNVKVQYCQPDIG